jgi:serine/threonine protein kinase
MPSIDEVLHKRYLIIRQLGQGGMGTVYEAEDIKRFGKLVAIKEILINLSKIPDQSQQEKIRRAFEREAKILTEVDHEAFPQVIDYFTESGSQFLVMEMVKGDELGELLKSRQTPFAVEEILNWADQLLDALDYLHTLSPPVIHRDVKPQNLKLTARGKIKLLDFGIAKGEDLLPGDVTNQTFIAATMNYSPVEQILRVLDNSVRAILAYRHSEKVAQIERQPADPRSDIFALGATLYHLLTNQLPLDALKRALEVWAGKPDPLIEPQLINPDISPEMSAWLLEAMAVDCEDRFVSASAMRRALNQNIGSPEIYKTGKRIADQAEDGYPSQAESAKPQPSFTKAENAENSPAQNNEETLALPAYIQSLVREENHETKAPRKINRLFLILPVAALSLLFLGIVIMMPPIYPKTGGNTPPPANSNPKTPPINNNENANQPAKDTPSPIDNSLANTIKQVNSQTTPKPKKTGTPKSGQKHPPKTNDPDCIFNDDCR